MIKMDQSTNDQISDPNPSSPGELHSSFASAFPPAPPLRSSSTMYVIAYTYFNTISENEQMQLARLSSLYLFRRGNYPGKEVCFTSMSTIIPLFVLRVISCNYFVYFVLKSTDIFLVFLIS